MYRRELLAATAVCCAASIAGCGDAATDEQSQVVQDTDERSSVDDSEKAATIDEIQSTEQSTDEEMASIEASAKNEIIGIQDDTIREIELLEKRGENWLKRADSRDGAVLVDTVEDFVGQIRSKAEKGRQRIQTARELEQKAIDEAKSNGQDEIEGIPGSMLEGEPDDEIETAVQTAVDTLETSAQDRKEAIETTAQEARAAITNQAENSIGSLETKLEQRQ